ncbi:hypothetical protein N6B98_002347 [Vibrio metschnikovii]|uniref:polysialyltransferase family glycosyltransferase n=1 Tax=Vibrio metschnikovii TaxID=28172 RepID=UPI00287A0942|nr:hypothetical protein [Vibrio metschnikovii]ELF5343569.1 hypothetical protein [Vibrio metschnikovii]
MKKKDIVIVATGIVSPFHVACMYALLEVEFSEFNINLFVESNEYWGRSIIPERYREFGDEKYNLFFFSNINSYELNAALKVSDRVVLIGVTHIPVKKYIFLTLVSLPKLIICYTIEEGIGSYTFTFRRRLNNLIEEGNPYVKAITKNILNFSSLWLIDKLSSTKNFRLTSNDDKYINALKSVFKKISEKSRYSGSIEVLFLSQPFNNIGYKESPVNYIVNSIQKIESAPVMVKLHPAEHNNLDSEFIIDFDGCVEEFFFVSEEKIKRIYSISSTSLYTMKILYGVETFQVFSFKYPTIHTNHTVELELLLRTYAEKIKID